MNNSCHFQGAPTTKILSVIYPNVISNQTIIIVIFHQQMKNYQPDSLK